ncbi:MAG: hypothetical protein KGI93_05330 [Acidobacteriota bacterium]|nr:hypothetical protein [Acidobacteriota bacterium]MDE3190065.1 hypothetical protein [Acidobacteriota bacterium]
MTALAAAATTDRSPAGRTIRVRVTDPALAPGLVSYFDRLGLRALGGPDGSITIRPWADVEWAEAQLEIAIAIDGWVRNHGVPVQLG